MRRLLIAYVLAAACLPGQTVPPVYQDLYDLLNTQISAFDQTVLASWNGKRSAVTYAPQLLSASSTEYTKLLDPGHYDGLVTAELTELQALGAQAVTVHIDFPILYQPFYVSNAQLYQQFVSFYQQLSMDVHSRGMKLVVETGIGMVFPGNQAGAYTQYLMGLSWDDYMTGRAQNAVVIAQQIEADYMSVVTEPDTEASTGFQPNVGTVSGATQLLQTILAALTAAGPIQTKIGAGTGTWILSFTQYVQSFLATSIDYFDLHVYPVNNGFLTNLLTAATTIQAAGKPIAMSEVWDYKVRNNELGILTPIELYARDPFSFWGPVDIAFLQAMSDYANYEKILFLGPFWTHYFAAYLDYNKTGTLPDSVILNDSYTVAINANLAGRFTSTGLSWLSHAVPAPDNTGPAVPSQPLSTYILPDGLGLAWSKPPDNVGVAGYRLYRNGSLLYTTSLQTYNDTSLTPGATYNYLIEAFDASGNVSGASPAIRIQTIDTTPPSVPAHLKATGVEARSVSLSWSPSRGIGGVGGYVVFRGDSPTSLAIRAGVTATTFTDYTAPSTTYYYAVESYNPLGIPSAQSPAISVTTPAN